MDLKYSEMNENKRLIKNMGLIAIGNMGTRLVAFFLLPLYTTLLTTSEYGIFDYIMSIAIFCVPFVSLLMDESIFRFLIDCKNDNQKTVVTTTSVIIMLAGVISFFVIATPVMLILKFGYAVYTIIIILMYALNGMFSALLRGIGRTDLFALYSFLLGASQVILNIIFIAYFRLGLKGMLLSMIIAQSLVTMIFMIKTKIWTLIDIKAFDKSVAKKMLTYGIPLIPNKISWNIMNLSDRFILMNVMGSDASGLYAVSNKFPSLMDTIYGFFYQSWKESSARVLGNESEESFYNSIYSYLKSFMYSLVLGMCAFMPLIFRVMINAKFNAALLYVPILLIAMYFSNISGFYGGIFTAYKQTSIMGISTVVGAIMNLAVNFILINYIGIYAAALSTLVSTIIVCIYRWVKVRKYVMLEENRIRILFAIIITVIILYMYYTGSFYLTIISCLISIVYAVIVNWRLIKILFKIKNRVFRK